MAIVVALPGIVIGLVGGLDNFLFEFLNVVKGGGVGFEDSYLNFRYFHRFEYYNKKFKNQTRI